MKNSSADESIGEEKITVKTINMLIDINEVLTINSCVPFLDKYDRIIIENLFN